MKYINKMKIKEGNKMFKIKIINKQINNNFFNISQNKV